jgi:hypothetical protein
MKRNMEIGLFTQPSSMNGQDIHRQIQACKSSAVGRPGFGGKKRREYFVYDLGRHSSAIVRYPNFDLCGR